MKNEQNQTILAGKVPAGYQQTEVGIIPEDWEVKKLSDISNFINGRAYSLQEWEKSGIPVIRLQNLTGRGEEYYYSNLILPEKQYCYYGDLLFMWSATFGPIIWKGEKAIYHYHIWKVECDKKQDTKHLYYLLSDMTEKLKRDSSNGGTMLHITKKEMESIFVPIPPLKEQTAIAEALSDVDSLLISLEKLIEKKRAIKTGTMQQLLTGKKRLPAFAQREDGTPKGYKTTELGEIPEDWEIVKLGDVVEKIIGGGTPSRSVPEYWGEDIPWVTVKDFATFNPYSAQEYISYEGLSNSSSNLIPKNTLITSTRMALGKAVIYKVDVAINQDLKALFCIKNLAVKFLYYWFAFHEKFINDLGSGSTVKGLALTDLKKIPFLLMKKEEQTAIAEILSDMDAEIEALEAKRAKTEEIKQGMMQELLTGRTRLI